MATYRLPFENVPGWAVFKGNFDDPGGGHGLGQPFAWDFGFPVDNGAKVLAARAGTVIDLRGDSTKVLATDDPVWGPGNYVIVEHSDRTIAAYDHMHPFSLQVNIGQYLDQGVWIGSVGNTGSTSGGVVHLHFECHTWFKTGSTGPGTVINDITGPSMTVHLEDANHRAWRPVDGDILSPLPVMSRQDGWRFCVKCGGLYFAYSTVVNACPAGGMHAFRESGDYIVPNNAANPPGQAGWSQCRKCSGLFFSLNPGSRCPVTKPFNAHDATLTGGYSVVWNTPNDPGQHNWRWCSKCQGLWFEQGFGSVCPSDGKPHTKVDSGDYSIEVNPQEVQRNWRKCTRCQGIYLATNGPGVCKAGPGGHAPGASASYILIDDANPVNTSGPAQSGWQGGWRYCKKCGGLWMGLNPDSHCPGGGAHTLADSGEYWLRYNTPSKPAPGEGGWKWCHKCQSLWSGGAGSRCPADNAAHSSTGSSDYGVVYDNFIWHWCSQCQGLWLGNNGQTGVCQAGGGHSLVNSTDYFLVCDVDKTSVPGGPGTQPAGWRYCIKCQALWMGLNSGSHCPDGGPHVSGAQGDVWEHGNIVLRFSGDAADAPGQQTHWKWCSKCQSLWMGKNSGSKCAADGLEHSSVGSGDYMLDHNF